MSTLGGIIDFSGNNISFTELEKMSLRQALCGRESCTAFLGGGVGMIFRPFCGSDEPQPKIITESGCSLVICVDSHTLTPSAVAEKYAVYGMSFAEHLQGDFAIALYDGKRELLLLLRSRSGRLPLYYREQEGRVRYASLLWGLIDDDSAIKRDKLREHIFAPAGSFDGADIYADICRVRAGECVAFSRFGRTAFMLEGSVSNGEIGAACSPYFIYKPDKLSEYLSDSLIAFGYPQFDAYVPSVLELFRRIDGELSFYDCSWGVSSSYAKERAAALSSLCGIRAITVPSYSDENVCGAMTKMYVDLAAAVSALNDSERTLLYSIFDRAEYSRILSLSEKGAKKEDAQMLFQSIRILGMLMQTCMWLQSSSFLLI